MRTTTRHYCPAALVLAWVVALAVLPYAVPPVWGQSTGAVDVSARAKVAAEDWARRLLKSFPESVRRASDEDKRITFQPLDPRDVTLGGRQRRLVYGWMLGALREAGEIGLFTVTDPRQHAAVARALENTGVENWSEAYMAAFRKHPTRIHLLCSSTPDARGLRLDCTARDTTNPTTTLGSASVRFRGEWLGAPLGLDQALEAVAGDVVRNLRGRLGAVSVVDQRVRRESRLAKYVADALEHRVVAQRAARPASSPVGGDQIREPVYELKGKLSFPGDRVELQVMVYFNDRPVNAVVEYATVESVARVERGLDSGGGVAPRQVFRDCDVCPEMVVMPPGEYMMGSPAGEKGRGKDEGPRRRVRIGAKLAVGRYEVTRREYAAFVKEAGRGAPGNCWVADGTLDKWRQDPGRSWRSPGFVQGERHAVVCVSWEDARAYARWLTTKTGKRYRLLSEAEWEYAARAGTATSRYWGDGAVAQCGHANGADAAFGERYGAGEPRRLSCRDRAVHTAEVGSHGANGFLLSDMLGNVWEWVEDCLHKDYAGAPDDGTAWVQGGDCGKRMLRGGSWYTHSGVLRSAARGSDAPESRNFDAGFRVARELGL